MANGHTRWRLDHEVDSAFRDAATADGGNATRVLWRLMETYLDLEPDERTEFHRVMYEYQEEADETRERQLSTFRLPPDLADDFTAQTQRALRAPPAVVEALMIAYLTTDAGASGAVRSYMTGS